jgi:hypothetical protein
MKKLKRKPMNKFALILAGLFSFNLIAAETQFGRVVDLKGEGFISSNGKTREIRKGESIELGAEIVIEHHGQVTFTDNADHRFHLGNASSASVTAKGVELRSGDLWFQSLNKVDTYTIKTANASVDYQGGEAILTYDSTKGKSQLMVINGMMKLSNLRASELNLTVAEGHFSFIDNGYEEGAPRDPTPVGEKTYGQLVALFNGVAPMDKNSETIFKDHDKKESGVASRAVASVHEEAAEEKTDKKVEIDSKMIEEYKNSVLAKKTSKNTVTNTTAKAKITSAEKKKVTTGKMVVHVYGQTSKPTIAFEIDAMKEAAPSISRSRAPASVLDQEVPNDTAVGVENKNISAPAVVSPYSKEYKQQYKESDKLIDDLKKL